MFIKAYSKEIKDIIDAEKAYELYWDGIIKNLKAFTCSEEGCEAQLTLSSVKKERRLLKQIPHFRSFGIHKKNCPNDVKNRLKGTEESETEKNGFNNRNIGNVDIINIVRIQEYKIENSVVEVDTEESDNIKRKYKLKIERDGKRESNYYTIIPIVSKYIKYKRENTLNENFIINEGEQLCYTEFFKELKNVDLKNKMEYNRIYFGEAKIIKSEEKNDFRIIFETKLKYMNIECTPSAYISDKIIQDSYRKHQWLKELNEYSNKRERVTVFILGKIKINTKKNAEGEEKKYININICNAKLDLIDIRLDK